MPSPIPMLQGWADEIAPGLKNIASGLGSFINPNYDVQQELKARIAADPKILQQLQDQEAANPGVIAKTFGNQAQALVNSGNASYAQKVELRLRKAADENTPLADIAKDPSVTAAGATRQVTGSNPAEYGTIQDNKRILDQAAENAEVEGPYKREEWAKKYANLAAQDELDKANIEAERQKAVLTATNAARTLEAIPAAKGIDGQRISQLLAEGTRLSAKDQQDLETLNLANPQATQQMITAADAAYKLRIEKSWHHSAEFAQTRQLHQDAIRLANDMDMPGSINAVMAYITDPNAVQRANDIASGRVQPKNQLEADLGNIAVRTAQKHELRGAAMKLRVSTALQQALNKNDKATPTERAGTENSINQALQTLSEMNGTEPVHFYYKDRSFHTDDKGFKVSDGKGGVKEVSPDEVSNIINAPPKNVIRYVDPLSAWRGLSPAERETKLSQMKPADAARVRAELAKPQK